TRSVSQTMCGTRPIPPSRTRLVVSDRMGAWCQLCTVCSTRPAEAAASGTPRESPGELTSGLSARQGAPPSGGAGAPPALGPSGGPSHPGRCPWMATLPSPMTAPRSMLLEPVLPDYGPQGLVEDGEPVERGLFADDQRRFDPHRRRIRHRGEPAPEALLVERLGHVLSERLLCGAVPAQVHAQ